MRKEKEGTVRCQKCLKFGHFIYQCPNEAAYRYRPSPTVRYKEQIKLALNKETGPVAQTKKKKPVQDRPSSSEEESVDEIKKQLQQKQQEDLKKIHQKPIFDQQSESSSSQSSSSEKSSQGKPRKIIKRD